MIKAGSQNIPIIEVECKKLVLLQRSELVVERTKDRKLRKHKRLCDVRAAVHELETQTRPPRRDHVDFIKKNRADILHTFKRLEPMIRYILQRYATEQKNLNNRIFQQGQSSCCNFLKKHLKVDMISNLHEFQRECCLGKQAAGDHQVSQVGTNKENHQPNSGTFDGVGNQTHSHETAPTAFQQHRKSLIKNIGIQQSEVSNSKNCFDIPSKSLLKHIRFAIPCLKVDFERMRESMLVDSLKKCSDQRIYSKMAAVLEVFDRKIKLMEALAVVLDDQPSDKSLLEPAPDVVVDEETLKKHFEQLQPTTPLIEQTRKLTDFDLYSQRNTTSQRILEEKLGVTKSDIRMFQQLREKLSRGTRTSSVMQNPTQKRQLSPKQKSQQDQVLQPSKTGSPLSFPRNSQFTQNVLNQQARAFRGSTNKVNLTSKATFARKQPQLRTSPLTKNTTKEISEESQRGSQFLRRQPETNKIQVLQRQQRKAAQPIIAESPLQHEQSPSGSSSSKASVCSGSQNSSKIKQTQPAKLAPKAKGVACLGLTPYKTNPNISDRRDSTGRNPSSFRAGRLQTDRNGIKSQWIPFHGYEEQSDHAQTQEEVSAVREITPRHLSGPQQQSQSRLSSEQDSVQQLTARQTLEPLLPNLSKTTDIQTEKDMNFDFRELEIDSRHNFVENRSRLVEECKRIQSYLKRIKSKQNFDAMVARTVEDMLGVKHKTEKTDLHDQQLPQKYTMTYQQCKVILKELKSSYIDKNSHTNGSGFAAHGFFPDMFRFCFIRADELNSIEPTVEIIRRGRGKTKPPTVRLPRVFRQSNAMLLDHGRDFDNALIAFAQTFDRQTQQQTLQQQFPSNRVMLCPLRAPPE